jgi:hypothetical protein
VLFLYSCKLFIWDTFQRKKWILVQLWWCFFGGDILLLWQARCYLLKTFFYFMLQSRLDIMWRTPITSKWGTMSLHSSRRGKEKLNSTEESSSQDHPVSPHSRMKWLKCLRPKDNGRYYVFPHVDDISSVPLNKLKKTPQPTINNRGHYFFWMLWLWIVIREKHYFFFTGPAIAEATKWN